MERGKYGERTETEREMSGKSGIMGEQEVEEEVNELNFGVFLSDILNQFHATTIIIHHFAY